MESFTFEIQKNIGVISETNKKWTREVNIISWNDRPAKYDIRDWSPDKSQMSKGLSFTKEELISLKNLLNQINLD